MFPTERLTNACTGSAKNGAPPPADARVSRRTEMSSCTDGRSERGLKLRLLVGLPIMISILSVFSWGLDVTAKCLNLTEHACRQRVERLPEVHRFLKNKNVVLESDGGNTKDDPYYNYYLGFKIPPPGAGSPFINRYAVDPCTGKVLYGTTMEEVKSQ
jgi:hypothetical protein